MAYVLDVHGEELGQCSGTVVAPNLVLTAAHCAESTQTGVVDEASGFHVMTGSLDWAAAPTEMQLSDVSKVIVCSCFDRQTLVGDVALLELSTPTTAPVVTLASSQAVPAGAAAVFAGWGETEPNQVESIEQLRWAATVVEGSPSCKGQASPFSPASEICAVDSPDRTTGGCHGDSGGPLLVHEAAAAGGMLQIGVVSHGYDECATTSPTVFTRVEAISDWVAGWARALAPEPPSSEAVANAARTAPALAGIAMPHSLSLSHGTVSLALACDSEGGVCTGKANATVAVRVTLTRRRDGRSVVSRRVRVVRLLQTTFAIAPGASIVVRARLSAPDRLVLSRLGGAPVDVTLTGQGIADRVLTLAG